MSENGEIYTAGKKFYTPAGTDGMDKFHLWSRAHTYVCVHCALCVHIGFSPPALQYNTLAQAYCVARAMNYAHIAPFRFMYESKILARCGPWSLMFHIHAVQNIVIQLWKQIISWAVFPELSLWM